ncbi:hypothetical protein PZN02_000650 [Sinorhizobium garamanticum]|uniref:Uncharacterized protein n=1 Tax=Sinorhizobium garamanticum TaxID=680247 RepID=A0ABY8DBB9_9HYPH|nr:hypothetical protein [Sinorhizobium garamanticum]WEX88186.1 hypothetical protein PZN02_000650 [Sinorhizobium garamanticum]
MNLLGGSKSMQASRLFAVLWLFCASFAMQVIAVGQSASSRVAAGVPTGNVALPDTGSSDRPVVRQGSRAVTLPDLRLVGERADGKSTTGGDLPPVLLFNLANLPTLENARPPSFPRADVAAGAPFFSERIRAPPRA